MSDLESASQQQLLRFLEQNRVNAELLAPGVPMPTVSSAAAAIGAAEEQIIKSVLFVDRAGNAVLAIACGTSRIDLGLLAQSAGTGKLSLAKPEVVLEKTGFPAGGVAPVGHATMVPVVMDRKVLEQAVVYGGAGTESSLARFEPEVIQRLTGALIADIVRRPGN